MQDTLNQIEFERYAVRLAWERGDLTTEQTGPLLDALDTREAALADDDDSDDDAAIQECLEAHNALVDPSEPVPDPRLATLDAAADRLTARFLAGRLDHASYERGAAYLATLAARIRAESDVPTGFHFLDN